MAGVLTAIWRTLCDVVLFWQTVCTPFHLHIHGINRFQQFFTWLTRRSPSELWLEILRDAKTYEEWEEAAFQVDVLSGNDLWYIRSNVQKETTVLTCSF
jgi:TAG lipase/lysophosphatidylethanolamine acyltransferase